MRSKTTPTFDPRYACVVLTLSLGLGAGSVAAQVGSNSGVLNPNLASESEMAALPGVTPALAEVIVEARPFLAMAAFDELVAESLGSPERDDLYARLFVPVNLNLASEAEILLVPGVGNRMAHEFEEYRPYRALAQFRREIGKYVDDDEVARFERYVTLD